MSGEGYKKTKGELLCKSFSKMAKNVAAFLFAGNPYIVIAQQEEEIAEIEDDSKPSCGTLHKCVALLLHFGTIAFIINSSATFIKYSFTQKLLFSIFISKIIAISTGALTALNALFFLFAIFYRQTKVDMVINRNRMPMVINRNYMPEEGEGEEEEKSEKESEEGKQITDGKKPAPQKSTSTGYEYEYE